VVVDLARVRVGPGPGVRVLIAAAQSARENGGRLALVDPEVRTRRWFKVTGADLLVDL
jgi:anti-anti-sigma regulatory factor